MGNLECALGHSASRELPWLLYLMFLWGGFLRRLLPERLQSPAQYRAQKSSTAAISIHLGITSAAMGIARRCRRAPRRIPHSARLWSRCLPLRIFPQKRSHPSRIVTLPRHQRAWPPRAAVTPRRPPLAPPNYGDPSHGAFEKTTRRALNQRPLRSDDDGKPGDPGLPKHRGSKTRRRQDLPQL